MTTDNGLTAFSVPLLPKPQNRSVCIYSQLKRCSSSEVAAMLEGLLRHDSDMEVQRNYTDSHGQTEVGFAFCHLLGFGLLPRLKAIASQKLHLPATGCGGDYPNLEPILSTPINWDLIRRQYDEIIKYATALRLGTAQAEAILRRFTKHNLSTPPTRRWVNLAGRSRPSSCAATWRRNHFGARFMRASTSLRTGTAPTASSSLARVVRSPPTSWRTRKYPCWRCTCCKCAWSMSTP